MARKIAVLTVGMGSLSRLTPPFPPVAFSHA
jgi:hypothetical protein